MAQTIKDPLLKKQSELIVEEAIGANPELRAQMLADVRSVTDHTREVILSAMLRMHKHLEDDCGDLDVSLNTNSDIAGNTDPWYGRATPKGVRESKNRGNCHRHAVGQAPAAQTRYPGLRRN